MGVVPLSFPRAKYDAFSKRGFGNPTPEWLAATLTQWLRTFAKKGVNSKH